MYPLISLFGQEIHFTGIAIIIALITFIATAYILTRREKIQFIKIFYRLPTPLILIYVLGSYIAFVSTESSRIPTTLNQIKRIISPHGYHFHIIGIIIGIILGLWIFLQKLPSRHERRVRINIIALSITISLIPLGLGVLMGDELLGLPTDSWMGVESFRLDISQRSAYGKIYPIGLFITITGLINAVIHHISVNHKKPSGQGYLTLAITTLMIGFIRTLVNTPKYLVRQIGTIRLDITTYITIMIATLFIQQYLIEKHKTLSLQK